VTADNHLVENADLLFWGEWEPPNAVSL
jgi:hypothetical protein